MKKTEWCALVVLILLALTGVSSGQKQYVVYSQNSAAGGYSDVIRYDTTTGETFFITGFSKTDSGKILSISCFQDIIYFTRSSVPNGRPNPAIWRVYIDGSGLTDFLSPDTTISYNHVAVSPDGNTIAYTANDADNPLVFQLYVCNSDGSNRTRLTFDPTWNCSYPVFLNNDTILFRVTKDQLEDYYTATLTGNFVNITNNQNLSPYFPRLGRPMVNYNRTAIIYGKQVQDISGYRKWAIYQLSPPDDTGSEVLLTDSLYFAQTDPLLQEEPYPAFYGTGDDRILFCGSLSGDVYQLYTVNIPIINPYFSALTEGSYHISLPLVTLIPDISQRYVYTQSGYVYVRNQDGMATRLTSGSGNRNPSINRRGTMVAFASSSGLYTIRPDGTGLIQIDSNPLADYPEFSPDGMWVFYVRNGDVYARRADGSGTSIRLTFTGNVAGDLRFSPSGQEMVLTGYVNSQRHIFICPVQISYSTMTVVAGTPVDLTSSTSENYQASFSPDGNTIIFISTRNQISELWLMNRDGTGQRKIIFTSNTPQNPASPCFSTGSSNIIYYISGVPQRIWRADISVQQIVPVSTGISAEYLQVSAVPLNTIEGERLFGITERDPYIPFSYHLLMHVDKIPLPGSAILTELIPEGWVLTDVKINGSTPVQMTSNGATAGELKWIFGPTGIAPVQDTVLQITIECQNPAAETYGEFRGFSGWCETSGIKTFTRGNSSIIIANPFIPIDRNCDWRISDEELLYSIYLWSINGRISMWPEDLSEWDFQLLSMISFWANPSGYVYNLTDSRSQGKYLWKTP